MIVDLAKFALKNIRSRQIRSWLTILGVLIGVTAIVALISLGDGMRQSVVRQFSQIGYDVIALMPSGGFVPGVGEADSAALDVEALREVSGIQDIGVLVNRTLSVSGPAAEGFLRVTAVSQEFLEKFVSFFGGFQLQVGRSFYADDSHAVVLGARSAQNLGVTAGDQVKIAGQQMTVVGVLKPVGGTGSSQPSGTPGGGFPGAGAGRGGLLFARFRTDDGVFIQLEKAQPLLGESPRVSQILLRVRPGVSVSSFLPRLQQALLQQRAPFTPISIEQIARNVEGTLGIIQGVLASIAAIALLVGSVGVMNTMYTAVIERTHEIGILKAIGAKDRHVLTLFLIDSGLMGLVGGLLGLVLGFGLSWFGTQVVSRLLGFPPFSAVFSPGLIVCVLVFSFGLGSLAGVWPARRAARLNPVDALRYE